MTITAGPGVGGGGGWGEWGRGGVIATSAVLRLECSIDCISGSVGHQQNIFRSFSHCQRLFGRRQKFKII